MPKAERHASSASLPQVANCSDASHILQWAPRMPDATQHRTQMIATDKTHARPSCVTHRPELATSQRSPGERARIEAHNDEVAANRRLCRAWGDWLDESEWSHVATLTSRNPLSEECLRAEFRNGFIRRAARLAQRPLAWFYAIERASMAIVPISTLCSPTRKT